ncbi:hypothetical protein N7466_008102 [Penicillium verhagenii]|uniref:uncharacterized protein n=1 Tax=Penicillium verhagenii TaxID=1562060 RepID=UPI00254596A4|nr:uncharacterized protein N7466_008102 [Penicillium verhagenii]KAJ5923915.1 hypothetical protein N7466_008102 [Penicillium verhagenii]
MALVAYSDSEGSDAEPDITPVPVVDKSKKSDAGAGFQVDRSNPRKIRVALPGLKSEQHTDQDIEDGRAPKKARLGGGLGGMSSGFNSFLPAPKRVAEKKAPVATTRKIFGLKTGATPGFDRQADAEFKNELANITAEGDGTGEDIPAAGSLGQTVGTTDSVQFQKTEIGEVKLQGNPMMFRPLSVANRNKRNTNKAASSASRKLPTPANVQITENPSTPAPPPPKPKVSLFSISSTDSSSQADLPSTATGTYEPLVYTTQPEAGPALAPESALDAPYSNPTAAAGPHSLENIADDLNLSKSERRQLFGRNAAPTDSQVRTFNTDKEYAYNRAMAATELAGTQHQPVRTMNTAGKHSLQQLVNAATSQKEALEENFATGKRNKKEAGSRYGW